MTRHPEPVPRYTEAGCRQACRGQTEAVMRESGSRAAGAVALTVALEPASPAH